MKSTGRGGYPGGSLTPDRGATRRRPGPLPLFCRWERRLSAEGMPDPDRVVIRTSDGPRLRVRRFAYDGGRGGRASRPEARLGLLGGRGEAADVRRARAKFDLRRRRMRRFKRRGGRAPVELRPGVRRAILDLHAQGVGYREICRQLRLGVSYGTVRRVVQEIVAYVQAEAKRPLTLRELVKACDPGLLRRLRRAGVSYRQGIPSGPGALRRLEADPVVADLMREDRRGTWDRMLDATPGS